MNKILGITAILMTAMFAASVLAIDGSSPSIGASANVYCNVDSDCATGFTCQNYACVAKQCGISASALDFGYIVPGTTKGGDGSIYSTLTNGGNTPTTSLNVFGTDWSYGSGTVGDTSWYYAGTWYPLSGSWQGTGFEVSPGTPLNIAFELAVPAGTPTGSATQTITFTAAC